MLSYGKGGLGGGVGSQDAEPLNSRTISQIHSSSFCRDYEPPPGPVLF